VYSTAINQPIFVTYLSSNPESSNESSEYDALSKTSATAVKLNSNKWHVCLNDKVMTVTDEDLIDSSKFFVEQKWRSVDENDEVNRKKQSAKQKRSQKAEQFEREKRIQEIGVEKLQEAELKEYNNLHAKIESGEGYQFEEFLEMMDWMRKPFVCQIDGHEVSLVQDNCAIMMERSTVHAITESLFSGKEKESEQQQNKQQRVNNATVRTECRATGIVALHQTEQHNDRMNRQAIKKAKDKLK